MKLDEPTLRQRLGNLPGWELVGNEIVKTYNFADYYETIAFVNAVAYISHRADHHPDLEVSYNRCKVSFSTHSLGGVSEADLACAQKVEQLGPAV